MLLGNNVHITKEERKMDDFDRLISKVQIGASCWLWAAGTYGNGYGQFRVGDKKIGAHRVSYEMFTGDIPPSALVMHSCDNRLCVNPEHLSVGSHKDNTADMIRKRRNRSVESYDKQRGPRGVSAELMEMIKREYIPRSNPIWKLAQKHGLNYSKVQRIISGAY